MFTGIITAKGQVVSLRPNDFGISLIIDPGKPDTWPAFPNIGDSVAVNGCCLTSAPIMVTSDKNDPESPRLLAFDVIKETLAKTSLGKLRQWGEVNLELALTPTTAIGGHFVQGHVDGTGEIKFIIASPQEHVLTIESPLPLVQYLVPKGSISVDGVSLTIAAVNPKDRTFSVALIPTTLRLTTLGESKAGDIVNLECDTIAKTIVHWLSLQTKKGSDEKITLESLKAAGFA